MHPRSFPPTGRALARCSNLVAASALALALGSLAADWPQWRGRHRDGLSPETGLLSSWPQGGPKLLWQAHNLGTGYSTPAVVGQRIYVLGNEGLENEFVQALSTERGERLWRTRLGKVGNPNQKPNFPAARSTPTVDGDLLFALGSDGDLACVETATGKVRWQKNLRTDFGGKPGTWAYAESPLVDGDTLLVTPGGDTATLVALHKRTGDVVWKCAVPGGDEAAYTSAMVLEAAGRKQYVQMLQKGLAGVDAATGKLLWRYARTVSRYGATIPTPLVHDSTVFSAGSGTGGGLVKIAAQADSVVAEEVYFSAKLPTAIGGAVKIGDYLYGTTGQSLVCAEFATGRIRWEERSLGAASVCAAEQRLYLHGENGEVALVEASPEAYREHGRFAPPDQPKRSNAMEKAWAYPVVSDGRLYLRDHNQLWCFTIASDSTR